METVVKLDKETALQQENLKRSLVSQIMDENTFIRQVDYVDADIENDAEIAIKVQFLIVDEIVLIDE